jgi:hypothetical protein
MSRQLKDDNGHVVPGAFPAGVTQTVAYTATHGVITNPVNTRLIEVYVTSAAYILVGAAPVADSGDRPWPANTPLILQVEAGTDKVSAVQQSAGGSLYVTELGG